MAADMVPRYPGYVLVVSRRYNEWQTLAFEATTSKEEELPPEYTRPLVDSRPYATPNKVLSRPTGNNGSKDSPVRGEEVVPRVGLLPRVVITIEEKIGDYRAPGGQWKTLKRIRDRITDLSHDGSRDVIGDLYVGHRSISALLVVNTIQERPKRRTTEQASSQGKKPYLHQM